MDMDETVKMTSEQEAKFKEDSAHMVSCFLLFLAGGNVQAHADLVHAQYTNGVKVGKCKSRVLCPAIPTHKVADDLLEWLVSTSAELTRMILVDGTRSDEWLDAKQHDLEVFEGRLTAQAMLRP